MNLNWLWLIIPAAVLFGLMIAGLCKCAKIDDLIIENARLRKWPNSNESDDLIL